MNVDSYIIKTCHDHDEAAKSNVPVLDPVATCDDDEVTEEHHQNVTVLV